MRDKGAGLLLLSLAALSVVVLTTGSVRSAERMDGKALYLANCSNCHGVLTTDGHGRLDSTPKPVATQLAVALPPGPTLNGVLGREAGTVPGYEYSRAFLSALRGVVWTRTTLDRWITDTPAWVPGAIMVYRQPDPAIRARIIDYLEHPSRDTDPTGGGDTGGRVRMMSSAIRR
jgi:cytochrome c